MKRPLITGMEDEETKAPTNSQELEDSIEKNNPANTSLPPSFSLEEELRQADEEAIKALESTTDADPVPSSLPVEEDDNAQKIKAAMAQSEAGKLTDKDATKFGAIPTSTESIKNQNYYQDILQNYAKLKDAQAGRRDSMANIGMLSAADELSASVARGYGGQRKVDPNSYKPFYDMADQPVQDIEQGMKLGKEAASISEMEEMANPNSDVSKLYREQAYALLKKLGKNEYEGKLEEMSANQLMKLPGMKGAMTIESSKGGQKSDLLSEVITDSLGSFRRNLVFNPNKSAYEYATPSGPVTYYGPSTRQIPYINVRTQKREYFLEGQDIPKGYVRESDQYQTGITSSSNSQPTQDKNTDISEKPKEQVKEYDVTTNDLNNAQLARLQEKLRPAYLEETKKTREALLSNNTAIDLIEGGKSFPGGDVVRLIQNKLSKASGEAGALSEGDVQSLGGSQAILDSLARWASVKAFNKLPESDRELLKNAASLLSKRSNEYLVKSADMFAGPLRDDLQDTLGKPVSMDSVRKLLGVDGMKSAMTRTPEKSDNMVKIKTPKGSVMKIPKENLQKAIDKGATLIKE